MKSIIDIIFLIKSTLRNEDFIKRHRISPQNFTRVRKLSFGATVGMLMQLAKKSLQIECNLLFAEINEDLVSKQAFSKARYKVDVAAFQELHQQVLCEYYQGNNQYLWKGYRVFAGDGSLFRVPEKEQIAEFFGRWEDDKAPLARAFEYVEVTTDTIVSATIAPWKLSENYLAAQKLPELTEQMRSFGQEKLLYIYDRGFRSYKFIKQHEDLKVDYLLRVPKCFSPKLYELALSGETDKIITLTKEGLDYICRVVFFTLDSGEIEILLTNIMNQEEISREEIIELYHMRWRSEESFKVQKQTMQLENFLGESVHAVCQEFWATILMATMLTLYCNEIEQKDPEFGKGNRYRVNRSVVFASMKRDFFRAITGEMAISKFKKQFENVARRSKIPIRPGRSYSRECMGKPKHRKFFSRCL